ncbi:DgyrCDS4439 [Dimorphilus gyrociliatus]|uniref:DgyrCDS4439 n=1 Tax=Dimorphilus gyrociliatus TaxID=2664684 RepID=A0A7I8VH11_9ANNE|nr:DgyrCDS4439 [Dimorphilus gyrociliatus]
MDVRIRTLLTASKNASGLKGEGFLREAFDILITAGNKPVTEGTQPFGIDLFVVCAEEAISHNRPDIAKECIKLFKSKSPPSNQFLGRAYLVEAQLVAPTNANQLAELEEAIGFILKAINMARDKEKYHFLIYNASLVYWSFCRPFLKPVWKKYLSKSLHQIVKALDEINDPDKEWKATLMITLIECHLDAGSKQEASAVASVASTFVKQNVPSMYKQLFALLVRHQLVDFSSAKYQKDIRSSSEINVFFKICKLKSLIDQKKTWDKEVDDEAKKILNQMGVLDDKDIEMSRAKDRRTPSPSAATRKMDIDNPERPYLLLEMSRLASEYNLPQIMQQCLTGIKIANFPNDPNFPLQLELMECDLMVKKLGENRENYQKNLLEVRLIAIKRCDEALTNSARQQNAGLIQSACATLWNLCLPVLQTNLRIKVRRPLTNIVEALEEIDSLLFQFRCQVHTELAKIEEDVEQLEVAIAHIRKAIALDDAKTYKELLESALHRIELKKELYQQPDVDEDAAAMIIEQARSAETGTVLMKRSILVKAGQALAPDAFLLVLESESPPKEVGGGKADSSRFVKYGHKAEQFWNCIKKAPGHLKRLGSEKEHERAKLWADLAKTARKQEVWDVCRVACRFCLLYDDGRFVRDDLLKEEQRPPTSLSKKGSEVSFEKPATPPPTISMLFEKHLLRTLVEVYFVQGEALIHLLRSEGVELYQKPIPPEDRSIRPKGYVTVKAEDDPHWQTYCDWLDRISEDATKSFLRASEIGVNLNEPWVVCSSSAYLWNYNQHRLSSNKHSELVKVFEVLLNALKSVGHAGETIMLVSLCNALAKGLLQPWDPLLQSPGSVPPRAPSPGKKQGGLADSKSKQTLQINPDGIPFIKQAIEVCEFCMDVTDGKEAINIVPISVRVDLLHTWVRAKQLSQSQIGKELGTNSSEDMNGQKPMTRSIVVVEMHSLNNNGIMEFKEIPPLEKVAEMIQMATWEDHLVELKLWTTLTYHSFKAQKHQLVLKCSDAALEFHGGTLPKGKKRQGNEYIVEREMLFYSATLRGRSLVDTAAGKNAPRRLALQFFLKAALFAADAQNYELVMQAARRYWNAALPLIQQPIEREVLKSPLTLLLDAINKTTDKNAYKSLETAEDEDETSNELAPIDSTEKKKIGIIGGPEDDLTLRAFFYCVLFQSYADKHDWKSALEVMDKAINDMPRTNHRLLLHKHVVMVKAKLGLSVLLNIQKFKDDSEDYLAHMWRRVALCSKDIEFQLEAYQNAIEALTKKSSEWQKVDYLLELGQWLYCHEFPRCDATDQIEWAIDILLNMEFEQDRSHSPLSKKGRKETGSKSMKPKTKKPAEREKRKSTSIKKISKEEKAPDTARTTSDQSQVDSQAIIPIKKDAIIGVIPMKPEQKISDLISIKQLDYLLQCTVLLAEVVGSQSNEHVNNVLLAYGYLMRIWQVSLSASGPVMKELAKRPQTEGESDKGGKGKKSGKKAKEEEPVKERPKRKGPLDHLPSSIEAWAEYDAPEEVLEAFKQESMKLTGINQHTILKPMLTIYYLDTLVKHLNRLGFHHMVFPALALQDTIARGMLENRSLTSLIHLKSWKSCMQIGYINGIKFHEQYSDFKLNEDEVANSREAMAVWREKQAQVRREEKRLLDANVLKKKQGNRDDSVEGAEKTNTAEHIGRELGEVKIRNVWLETAEILITQGIYQPARDILNEVLVTARAYEDAYIEGKVLHLLGHLSMIEAQYGQAVALCLEAQKRFKGDEMFWYETTMIIIESTRKDYSLKNNLRKGLLQARTLVLHAVEIFSEIEQTRPNKQDITGFILNNFKAKLVQIQIDIILQAQDNLTKPSVITAILSSCNKLKHCWAELLALGYVQEALKFMLDQAELLEKIAIAFNGSKDGDFYYIEIIEILEYSVRIARDLFQDAITLTSPVSDLQHINLPYQRITIKCNVKYSRVLIKIFEIYVERARNQRIQWERKLSVEREVENLTRDTPHYEGREQQWESLIKTACDQALTSLSFAHSLTISQQESPNLIEWRAKCLFLVGRCVRLMSEHASPDPKQLWNADWIEREKLGLHIDESAENEYVNEDTDEFIKFSARLKKLKSEKHSSQKLLAQATEILQQSIVLSLKHGLLRTTSEASIELVECLGQFDPGLCSQYLSLRQSCEASLYCENLLKRALVDPTQSQLAALLKQRDDMLEKDLIFNSKMGPSYRSIMQQLDEKFIAWKRLRVSTHHMDLIKDLPPNITCVVLQFSPDKNYLYCSIMDKSKNLNAAAANRRGAGQFTSKAQVLRVKTSRQELEELQERWKWWKHDAMMILLKCQYKKTRQAQREKMLSTLDSGSPIPNESKFEDEDEEKLRHEYLNLIECTETYLSDISKKLKEKRPTSGSTMSKDAQSAENECIAILADIELLKWPLEALRCLQADYITSVSRDVSLQMLHHKMYIEPLDEAAEKALKEKEKNKPPSRIPGLRDAAKKQSKIVPLERPVPSTCLPVDTHAVRFVVDPNSDAPDTDTCKPIEIFNEMVEKHSQQFTPRWLGVAGSEHSPSVGEYEIYLNEGSGFIYYGMERFACQLSPSNIASLNLPECQFVMLLDLMQTGKSFSRRAKTDVLKTQEVLNLEKPVETSILLGLTGVRCVLSNQWHCSLEENAQRIHDFMKDFLPKAYTTGEATRFLSMPHKRKPDETAEEEAEETENESSGMKHGLSMATLTSEQISGERSNFNMVCYGAPNLMVTQFGK